MASPHTLVTTFPPEILIQIFDTVAYQRPLIREDYAPQDTVKKWYTTRYALLKPLSLVTRSWKDPACALLWQMVWVSEWMPSWILLKGLERELGYRTGSLVVFAEEVDPEWDGESEHLLEHLLTWFEGLEHLTLRGFHKAHRVPLQWLTFDNLHSLTSLTLADVYLHSPRRKPQSTWTAFPLRAPCSLQTLRLHKCQSPHDKLFTFFSSPKLRELHFNPPSHTLKSEQQQNFISFITKHTAQLRKLEVNSPNPSTIPSLLPILPQFVELSNLEIYCTHHFGRRSRWWERSKLLWGIQAWRSLSTLFLLELTRDGLVTG